MAIKKNIADLGRLKEFIRARQIQLVFVTGRHLKSVRSAITEHQLPYPDLVICDVGTSIYCVNGDRSFELCEDYARTLDEILSPRQLQEFGAQLESIVGLRQQESSKQGPFKLSFYCDSERLSHFSGAIFERINSGRVPIQLIASVDPFNNGGLIDLLPLGVSKAFALDWWIQYRGATAENVVFAGDSGNDLAALTVGYRTIVVGNADVELIEEVKARHEQLGFADRLFVALERATSGVLEGCRHWNIG